MKSAESKTIHEVGQMVGILPKETDKILVEIRANRALLDSCKKPHDFSICLDRHTKQAIESPTPAQHFGAKWKCSECGGIVDSLTKLHYNDGLADATADLQAQVEQLRGELAAALALTNINVEAELHQRTKDLKNMIETYRYDTSHLRAALENCVAALEFVGCRVEHPDDSKLPGCPVCERVDDALATAEPLLNKP